MAARTGSSLSEHASERASRPLAEAVRWPELLSLSPASSIFRLAALASLPMTHILLLPSLRLSAAVGNLA